MNDNDKVLHMRVLLAIVSNYSEDYASRLQMYQSPGSVGSPWVDWAEFDAALGDARAALLRIHIRERIDAGDVE